MQRPRFFSDSIPASSSVRAFSLVRISPSLSWRLVVPRKSSSKADSTLSVLDAGGKVIFFAPVTSGSEHNPLPIGDWKVTGGSAGIPSFNYNPSLFWDAESFMPSQKSQPGPNNPVGVVSGSTSPKSTIGIHGSPRDRQNRPHRVTRVRSG